MLMTLLKFCVLIVEWSNVKIADSIRFMHCVNNIDMVFWMWLVNHSYEFVCKIMITSIGSSGYWNNKNGLKAYLVTMIPCDLVCFGWCRGTFWLRLYSILWKIGSTEYFCFISIGRIILFLPYAIQFGLIESIMIY